VTDAGSDSGTDAGSGTERTPRPPDLGRRTLTPLGYAICVAVPFLIAALGFTYLHFHYDKEQLVSGERIPILTSGWRAGDDAATAQIEGKLVLGDDGCLRLATSDGSEITPVWPADFEASVQRVGSGDQVRVYDTERNVVARGGDVVSTGGAYQDVGEYAGRPCAPASGEVAVIMGNVTVGNAQ